MLICQELRTPVTQRRVPEEVIIQPRRCESLKEEGWQKLGCGRTIFPDNWTRIIGGALF
jgi:hypothetical protein